MLLLVVLLLREGLPRQDGIQRLWRDLLALQPACM